MRFQESEVRPGAVPCDASDRPRFHDATIASSHRAHARVVWRGAGATLGAWADEVTGAIGRSIARGGGADVALTLTRGRDRRGESSGRDIQPVHETSYWRGTIDAPRGGVKGW